MTTGTTTERPRRVPGPDHPITIEPNSAHISVWVGGKLVADTRNALTLREGSYPPVQYIPRKDVNMSMLQRTSHSTYCPYKGDASYYSIAQGGTKSVNAVWTYESAYPAVEAINNYVAFYPDRVDEIEIT
jgi:uncharacterized protein (DUF427 family)